MSDDELFLSPRLLLDALEGAPVADTLDEEVAS